MSSKVRRAFAALLLCSSSSGFTISLAADPVVTPATAAAPATTVTTAAAVTTATSVTTAAAVTPMTPDVVPSFDAFDLAHADYVKRVEMVPMRDGVKLYTVILFKKGTTKAPILLSRDPYDAKDATQRNISPVLTEVLPAMDAEFVTDGYIRVYQDVRGMHHSEGEFVMTRPIIGPLNHTTVDESTDAYDTIDWLVKNIPESNGNVGVVGSSYLGFTTLMAEINPHPALKAVVPESPMVDTWIGDDDFHNGAFRAGSLDYALEMGTNKGDGEHTTYGPGDDYSLYLGDGSTGDHAKRWGLDKAPFSQLLLEHPAYDPVWSLAAVDKWLAARSFTVPTMLVVGQWDQEDSYGAPAVYRALLPKDHDHILHLVIGPWRHSGVNHYGYGLGDLSFTGDTAQEFRVKFMKPFFDHYLKGAPDPKTPAVLTYATGADHWEESAQWPNGKPVPLYLHEGFTASFVAPTAPTTAPAASKSDHDDYVSDPAKPVPFIPRPIHIGDSSQWTTWLVHDQRFVSDRPDVLVYATDALTQPLHIMGAPAVDLFAATSGTDSDWVVKLIDVYPDTSTEGVRAGALAPNMAGYELPIGIEIFRGRYVSGFDKPRALKPGKVEEYRWNLPNVDHVFLPGHRIMVQVQSSLFPLYDRNPQTYVDNIFWAKPADYHKATQSVFHAPKQASAVILPVADH
jgi:putative CocE/NonD family hydrolase